MVAPPPRAPTSTSSLATAHVVNVDEFGAALPESVVAPQQRKAVIADMLADVPLPAGVDRTTLTDQTIYSDRVSLATGVVTPV